MKGVTGGSLPAQIWKRFVSAAAPLLNRLSPPVVAQVAGPLSPMPGDQVKCNHNACGVAYVSFQPSDCTYQPHIGPRRLCEKGGPRMKWTAEANNEDPTPRVDTKLGEHWRVPPRSIEGWSTSAASPMPRSRPAEGSVALAGSDTDGKSWRDEAFRSN